MIKRFLVILFVVNLSSSEFLFAQDPNFSQFYANLLYLNPAFAGSERCPRASVNYRNEWPALGKAYVTYTASYDQNVDLLEGALGLLLLQDIQADGAITTTNVNGIYSYTLPVTRNFSVRGGFEASYFQKRLNKDFIYPDMIDPLYGPIFPTGEQYVQTENNKGYFDFSAGVLGFTRNYYFGFAVNHLTQPSESWRGSSDAVLPRKYTIHFGTTIPLTSRRFKRGELSISPSVLYQRQQNFEQADYGLYLNRKSIVAGVWLRQNFAPHADSFIMLLGYVQPKFKFAYSYDLTVSKLKNETLGAHEVSISMVFNCKQKKKKFRTISCPSF